MNLKYVNSYPCCLKCKLIFVIGPKCSNLLRKVSLHALVSSWPTYITRRSSTSRKRFLLHSMGDETSGLVEMDLE